VYLVEGSLVVMVVDNNPSFHSRISGCMRAIIPGTGALDSCIIFFNITKLDCLKF